jgi:hypothetical protein
MKRIKALGRCVDTRCRLQYRDCSWCSVLELAGHNSEALRRPLLNNRDISARSRPGGRLRTRRSALLIRLSS